MAALLYVRLIGYTAGTLLMLFWMVVILGYRRQRNFERVFFFLCLALFFFYGGSLLALNAQLYYTQSPPVLTIFSWTVLAVGLCFAPAILLHLHLEYAHIRGSDPDARGRADWWKRLLLTFAYASIIYFALKAYPRLATGQDFDLLGPATSLGPVYGVYLGVILLAGAVYQWRFSKLAEPAPEQRFHRLAAAALFLAAVLATFLHVLHPHLSTNSSVILGTALTLLPILPFVALIYAVEKHNFLQIGRQKNLIYAIAVTFLALLYLALVRRVGIWLDPVLPPEATAAILLFILVIFIEPLQCTLSKRLQLTAQLEVDRVQKLMPEIHRYARQGDRAALRAYIEEKIRAEFGLESTDLRFVEDQRAELRSSIVGPEQWQERKKAWEAAPSFGLRVDGRLVGFLSVKPHGAAVPGETAAALALLCEQLPAALDLCRLIEEKLLLERALAEQERMAALGQMAASISHNLKNPLGSIKTILQVQLENPELPESFRGETKLMLDEISRLSTKLSQLLQFSRPVTAGEGVGCGCDANGVAQEVAEVLRHGAEEKGLRLEVATSAEPARVRAGAEAVSDILSNLVVNALDATQKGGTVQIEIARRDGKCVLSVEDDGPGVPTEVREKILQPFFTTKAQGTGLGLAIVARRAADAGGKVEIESPARNGRGARFVVSLPLGEEKV